MGVMRHENRLMSDLAMGAVAGAFATWVMGKATAYLYEHESREGREREDEARDGDTAYGAAARKGADLLDAEISDDEKARYGSMIHWALGIGAGAVYAALRRQVPAAGAANGLVFGTAFWALIDEAANPALGLTPGPTAFPWQTHARGLAGHLVFGVAADTTLRALDRVA